ncbi:uncharacterized protein LOC129319433 [Prosopis cineraria]|uniref:uncharacterized protein LOC129319433 n=1 Tax=Prosopis cineraria TaxID=364024 RepID=UPI00240F88E0|nr:uncharacterized protein LOC129319433 [Prosopis cineraria]
MVTLYGCDRASRKGSLTTSDMRKWSHTSIQPEIRAETIDKFDNILSENDVTLENFLIEDHSPEVNSANNNKSKQGLTLKEKELEHFARIEGAMLEVANAIKEGNAIIKEKYFLPISGEKALKMIEESGCDINKISDIYCFLMNDLTKLRVVIVCPLRARKQIIMKMFFGF